MNQNLIRLETSIDTYAMYKLHLQEIWKMKHEDGQTYNDTSTALASCIESIR
jgi:hypothetical protein